VGTGRRTNCVSRRTEEQEATIEACIASQTAIRRYMKAAPSVSM